MEAGGDLDESSGNEAALEPHTVSKGSDQSGQPVNVFSGRHVWGLTHLHFRVALQKIVGDAGINTGIKHLPSKLILLLQSGYLP